MQLCDKSMKLNNMSVFAVLCAAAVMPGALLAEKTTNTYERTSSAGADITWSTAGFPSEVTTTAGSDISIKIDYAEGGEKYQRIKTASLPIYLDSVIGGKYDNLSFVNNAGSKYAIINNPTPFKGFWSIDANPARASGIYLPDNDGAGVRTIGSAFLKGRFQFGVATGCEAILDYPFGLGMFQVNRSMSSMTGSGKLTVNRSPGPYSVALVDRGTLGIVGGDDDVSSPVPGAWARFDATVESSFTFENETGVTQWRDAEGREVSASVESAGANRPQRVLDAVTGKTLVDFGFRSGIADREKGGSRLKFPATVSGVGELFMVFREKNDVGTPLSFFSKAFPRHGTSNYLFAAWGSLPKELAMGEFRLNGQAVVPDVAYNFSRGLNVVSAGYRSGGGEVLYFGSEKTATVNSDSAGGDAIAEVILYTNTLTAAQRRHNNEYLMRKWKGVGIRDYGAIMLANGASLSVESGTARVRELLLATNGFVKAGSGKLEVESLNTNLSALAINGGTMKFVNTLARAANPQPAADPFAWFDADDSDSLVTMVSNYNDTATTFVTNWRDKRGNNGYTLARQGALKHKNCGDGSTAVEDETPYPTLDTTTATRPMVDLGPFYNPTSSKHFGWINGNSGLSTWLCLYKDGVHKNGNNPACGFTRQGFVVFYKTNKDSNPIQNSGWELRNGGSTAPRSRFLSNDYAGVAALGGHWTYDGKTINPSDIALPADGKAHLGSFLFADAAPAVNVYGADMDITGNSSGGCKIAEVILYDRVLTEQERLDTERYLMAKWNCGTHPADNNISSVGTLTFNNGTPAVIDVDDDMTFGRVDRDADGAVVKKGAGNATISVFDPNAHDVTAVTVEGGSLTLTCDPLADAWAHLDATRADSIVYTTANGTNYVSCWKDISGHGNDATPPSGPAFKPTWHAVHLDADSILSDSGREMMVVDMGEYYNYEQLPTPRSNYPTNSASAMDFPIPNNTYVALQEFYIVHADTDHWNGDGKNNYTGIFGFQSAPNDTHPFIRSCQSPLMDGLTPNAIDVTGYIGVNGEKESASYKPTFRQLNAYSVYASEPVSARWSLTRRGITQWGGQVLGEVILFQTANTEARRNAITAMLCNKWRAQNIDIPLESAWAFGALTVAEGSSLTVAGADGFAYTAETLGGLGTINSSCPILGVTNVVLGAEGAAGTLSVAADVTLAAGAFVDVYVDSKGNVSKVAMTGKLTVGGAATVRLHVPDGIKLPYGDYDIMTATSIAADGFNWSVDDTDGAHRGVARARLDSARNAIVLKVYPNSLMIIVR